MKCTGKKTDFDDLYSAIQRLKEISKSEKRDKSPKRAYLCTCGKYHLSSVDKVHIDKIVKKINDRVKIREQKFISREAKYWENKFNKL